MPPSLVTSTRAKGKAKAKPKSKPKAKAVHRMHINSGGFAMLALTSDGIDPTGEEFMEL